MAKTEFPFVDFDVKKLMGDFDVNKMLGDFKVPGVDVEKIMDIHRKNLEAIVAVNKTVAEGLQEMARVQSEMLKESMSDIGNAVKELTSGSTPEGRAARQAELAKAGLEKLVSNMKSVGEIAMKYNQDVVGTIQGRLTATVEEVKGLAQKGE